MDIIVIIIDGLNINKYRKKDDFIEVNLFLIWKFCFIYFDYTFYFTKNLFSNFIQQFKYINLTIWMQS